MIVYIFEHYQPTMSIMSSDNPQEPQEIPPANVEETPQPQEIPLAEDKEPEVMLAQEEEESPFEEMMKREYEYAMDQEISRALSKINRRAIALSCQESSLTDVVNDSLGHDADWYEDLELAVRNNDSRVGETKEEVYKYLEDLKFTEMKPLEALQQMYPVSGEQPPPPQQ